MHGGFEGALCGHVGGSIHWIMQIGKCGCYSLGLQGGFWAASVSIVRDMTCSGRQ